MSNQQNDIYYEYVEEMKQEKEVIMKTFKLDKELMGLEEEAHSKAQDLVIKLCNFMDALKMGKSDEYPHGLCSNAALELDSLCAVMHYHSYVRALLGDNPQCKCDLVPLCPLHDKDLIRE